MFMLITIFVYFLVLMLFSRLTSSHSGNSTFFLANRRSPWYLVAFGMVGASISGVTFVSVPGMVNRIGMTYLQTCLGFIVGYFAVAFVLLPVYYRLRLTSIYAYLRERLGPRSHQTGAWFFLLSKMSGSVVRFYVICFLLQRFVFDALGVPFVVVVVVMVALIWLYTRRGGIKTLVVTDTFQTGCMLAALCLMLWQVMQALHLSLPDAITAVWADARSRVFVFDDWHSPQYFWKQFVSGIFIVIVMTGLDQDMMQKNLTCKTLREAQKDMCTYGFAFVPANLLFLSLGVLLSQWVSMRGAALPPTGDELLPMFVAAPDVAGVVPVLFTVGVVAASFSSADSALTALTTIFCVDICEQEHNERLRRRTHIVMSVVFAILILLFNEVRSDSMIDAIYVLCAYTYGPLLGLFAFGLFTRRQVTDRFTLPIALLSPLLCYAIDFSVKHFTGYQFGYELLLLNGALTFAGLWLFGKPAAVARS